MFSAPAKASIALIIAAAMAGAAVWAFSGEQASDYAADQSGQRALGLVTSLPIYWAEGDDFSAMLRPDAELPWVRQQLERKFELVPVDRISPADDGTPDLAAGQSRQIDDLLIVQPRGLSPADNVAIDRFVRDGGRLLIVIDPMLAGHYETPIGDPRHPSVVGLVPPLFARWGLAMDEREGEEAGQYLIPTPIGEVPVINAGQLRAVANDPADGQCAIGEGGLIARCAVGAGRATVMADATIFEIAQGNDAQAELIARLAGYAFD